MYLYIILDYYAYTNPLLRYPMISSITRTITMLDDNTNNTESGDRVSLEIF